MQFMLPLTNCKNMMQGQSKDIQKNTQDKWINDDKDIRQLQTKKK